jgi:aspartate--ammonia ligase
MNAIRRDDSVDNTHSIYVDQWDWELVITEAQRVLGFLKATVMRIALAIAETKMRVVEQFPVLTRQIEPKVFFITSDELAAAYPMLTPKERENEITKYYKTVFIIGIGGGKHDGRAPDYDDWSLNGDLLYWNELLGESLEISSMGIRVNAETLFSQLESSGKQDRFRYDYHQSVIKNELPLTIGGGIGQSRLCLLLLEKLHVGEVQVSIWSKEMLDECALHNIPIL